MTRSAILLVSLLLTGCSSFSPYDLMARGYLAVLEHVFDHPRALTAEERWAQEQTALADSECEARANQAWRQAEWKWQTADLDTFRTYRENRARIDADLRAENEAAIQACHQ